MPYVLRDGFLNKRTAESWDRHIKAETDPFRKFQIYPLIEKWCNSIKNTEAVLDIGCGQGITSHILRGHFSKVVGVDPSQHLIRLAKENYKGIDFVKAGGERLPFSQDSFDAVTCINVLFHISPLKLSKMFREIYRVLRSAGRVLITTVNPESYKDFAHYYKISRRISLKKTAKIPLGTKAVIGDPNVAGPNSSRITLSHVPLIMHPWKNIYSAIKVNGFSFVEEPSSLLSDGVENGKPGMFVCIKLLKS